MRKGNVDRDCIRCNMNIPRETLEKIDAYADKMTITRTAAVLILVNQALDAQQGLKDISDMVSMMKLNQSISELTK